MELRQSGTARHRTRGGFPAPLPGTQPVKCKCRAFPVGAHSKKPEAFAGYIDRLWPRMRKLKMYQRRQSLRPGDVRLNGMWDFWGNEAGEGEGP
ncbi:hypothetical protein LXM94_23770 [Rhizobium sp. TRM95111]|uniref:hypothetical protein n=1 Tax=Rhizobium alarense TaxID=2846851 RepID=UPI001F47E77A|nr:hypothetical protein [Rhizobium alarense]MCF3642986.1 hypothetical protein [Rhizobium alarense]